MIAPKLQIFKLGSMFHTPGEDLVRFIENRVQYPVDHIGNPVLKKIVMIHVSGLTDEEIQSISACKSQDVDVSLVGTKDQLLPLLQPFSFDRGIANFCAAFGGSRTRSDSRNFGSIRLAASLVIPVTAFPRSPSRCRCGRTLQLAAARCKWEVIERVLLRYHHLCLAVNVSPFGRRGEEKSCFRNQMKRAVRMDTHFTITKSVCDQE